MKEKLKSFLYFLFLLGVTLGLSGCASPQIVTKVETVKVPVTVYCKIKDVSTPDMPFDNMAKPSMTLFEKIQLLAAQDQNLKGFVTELQGAIAGCRAPEASPSPTSPNSANLH